MREDSSYKKERLSITLLWAGVVFVILIVSLSIAILAFSFLVRRGLIGELHLSGQTSVSTILLLVVVSGVIGATISAVIGTFVLRPVNRLINQMKRLASGDFSARLEYGRPVRNHPAIVELTDSFNIMAQELENTEILRGDFINNFSHEFKTPIVSIAGFAKLLRRGNLTPEQQTEYLEVIETESLRLSSMATNVLNLTKVENQTILSDCSEYNLSEQIRNCILLLESKWAKKNIAFQIEFGEHDIIANEELLMQVWINLLDNAIKFSPNGGTVEVRIRQMEDQISVSVLNDAEPIPEEQRSKIWNKFYQADESHASEGNGIGLALVDKIVRLHKGYVTVLCENHMVAFTVTVPKQ